MIGFMTARTALGLLLAAIALTPHPPAHAQELPAVARPRFQLGEQVLSPGVAFFLKTHAEPFAVAVTTAHAFELSELAAAGEVIFELGHSGKTVGATNRLLLPPGTPFREAGGSLRDDYLVFALDHELILARALDASPLPPEELVGRRVRLLGIPSQMASDQDDIFGNLVFADAHKIEVLLDVPNDLRGWGGAPVLLHPGGEVVGILEAAQLEAGTYRLGIAPIGGVVQALRFPAAGGLGIPFSRFASDEPPASFDVDGDEDKAPPEIGDGDSDSEDGAATPALLAPAGRPRHDSGPLLGRGGALGTTLKVEIEYPGDEAYIGDPEGAFVAGRALALLGGFRRFDVVLVIDTSGSTADTTGMDLNGNGIIGEDRFGGLFGHTDRGDSILAAELQAARRVLEGLDPRNTRVAVISFAGTRPPELDDNLLITRRSLRPDSITEQGLTVDYEAVERALDRIWKRGAAGLTNMTAGVRLAVRELRGFQGSSSTPDPDSEKIVMLFTDGTPTLPYHGNSGANVRSVMRASGLAQRAEVRIHSFAIGPEALRGPTAAVEMARITGGRFTPVREPGDLGEIVENVSFANIETLEVQNLTLDAPAFELNSAADGSFAALVPIQFGRNVLEVKVVATNGATTTKQVRVNHATGIKSPRLPRALMAARNHLLERRLISLKRGHIEVERARAEGQRRQLQIEIQKEREAAEISAEQQRRKLEIEAGNEDETRPAETEDSG